MPPWELYASPFTIGWNYLKSIWRSPPRGPCDKYSHAITIQSELSNVSSSLAGRIESSSDDSSTESYYSSRHREHQRCEESVSSASEEEKIYSRSGLEIHNLRLTEKETDEGEKRCPICASNFKYIACIPCGHVVFCGDCAKKYNKSKCPLCRKRIETLNGIYN